MPDDEQRRKLLSYFLGKKKGELKPLRREAHKEDADNVQTQTTQPSMSPTPQQQELEPTEAIQLNSEKSAKESKTKSGSFQEKRPSKRSTYGDKSSIMIADPHKKNGERIEKVNDEEECGSTRFVVVNAEFRPARTKLRKRNILKPPRGIKAGSGGFDEQTATEKQGDELLSDSIRSHVQKLEAENHALRNKISELRLRLAKQHEELNRLRRQLGMEDKRSPPTSLVTARPDRLASHSLMLPPTTASSYNSVTALPAPPVPPSTNLPIARTGRKQLPPASQSPKQKDSSPDMRPPQTRTSARQKSEEEHSVYL